MLGFAAILERLLLCAAIYLFLVSVTPTAAQGSQACSCVNADPTDIVRPYCATCRVDCATGALNATILIAKGLRYSSAVVTIWQDSAVYSSRGFDTVEVSRSQIEFSSDSLRTRLLTLHATATEFPSDALLSLPIEANGTLDNGQKSSAWTFLNLEVTCIREEPIATSPPATEAPPTEAPPTEAPPTEAPPTEAPPTQAPPPTETPPTEYRATEAPPTEDPVLPTPQAEQAPSTEVPDTQNVTTIAPPYRENATEEAQVDSTHQGGTFSNPLGDEKILTMNFTTVFGFARLVQGPLVLALCEVVAMSIGALWLIYNTFSHTSNLTRVENRFDDITRKQISNQYKAKRLVST